MNFGQNLQQHRKDKGLSQEALANQLFVTRQSVSQWENDRTMPSVDLLLKLSGIFGTTVDALLGKPETESIPESCGNGSDFSRAAFGRSLRHDAVLQIQYI